MPNGDEIIVEGRRFEPPTDFRRIGGRQIAPAPPEGRQFEPPITPPFPGDIAPTVPGLVSPGLPGPISEVIVRAAPPTAPSFGFGTVPRVAPAALFAIVGGLLLGKTLEELSQQRLESEFAELMRERRTRPDTPLVVQPPQTIPEIIVTGRQLQPGSLLQPIPQPPPLITPDFDPFVLVPFVPRFLPQPAAEPIVAVPVPEIPQPFRSPVHVPQRSIPRISPASIPTVQPLRIPATRRLATSPQISPTVAPGVQPAIQPATQPAVRPSVRPAVRPRTAQDPLTRLRRSVRRSLERRLIPRLQAGPALQSGSTVCPPCPKTKKEEDKPRSQCWKKLVKEGLLPSMDESFNWVRIDCLTGREL